MSDRFTVVAVEAMTFAGPDVLATHDLMSPFVWRASDGHLHLLMRVVANSLSEEASTGCIWHGTSVDGLNFAMDDAAVLSPEPSELDAKGCEDSTLVLHGDEVIVLYSGVDDAGDSHLLWASGPDVHSLTKRGVAHDGSGELLNIKEAEVACGPRGWIMGFEYADGDASRIAYADGEGPVGPWHRTKQGFGPRVGRFDSWHLSPGPMMLKDSDRPVMFYNGATRDGEWGVGWIVFDLPGDAILDRCEAPLLTAPNARDGRRIAFAASLIDGEAATHLYVSFNDQTCHRVTIVARDTHSTKETDHEQCACKPRPEP